MANATATKPVGEFKGHFVTLSPGKLAGLRQITDSSHRFKVLALDQSNSFKKALRLMHERAGKPAEPTYEDIRDTKLKMVETLGILSSAVLLDVNYGARQALNSMALAKGVGLIVRCEASRDAGLPSEYEPGWSVEKIKRMGAAAVKLLVYFDTEDPQNVKTQIAFVEKVSRECARADILLMTEELSFPRKGEDKTTPAYKARRVKNILEATRLLGPHTDILKLEFPGSIKDDSLEQLSLNLSQLNQAAQRPWVLLSAGEKFELFVKQAELAMKAGCSGYMAGRAIFNEYFEQTTPEARTRFLTTTATERMKSLNRLVDTSAMAWTERYGISQNELAAAVKPNWYLSQGESAASSAGVKGDY
jgi:tagatose 1,6-diphosphate aldolase